MAEQWFVVVKRLLTILSTMVDHIIDSDYSSMIYIHHCHLPTGLSDLYRRSYFKLSMDIKASLCLGIHWAPCRCADMFSRAQPCCYRVGAGLPDSPVSADPFASSAFCQRPHMVDMCHNQNWLCLCTVALEICFLLAGWGLPRHGMSQCVMFRLASFAEHCQD